jgi:diacylglycerol kinase (ATP)
MALEESAKRLALASTRRMDVGFCNSHLFLLWAGIGLDAFVVHRIEPRTRLEKRLSVLHYTASAVWHASFWRGINLRVEVDGNKIHGHFLLALASNIRLYAGGMATVSPNARLDDGIMDLWLFEGETLADTVQVAWEIWSGQHIESNKVKQFSIQQAHLESDSPMYVQVDAEPITGGGSVDIQISHRALKVLVPDQTPHTLFDHGPGQV